METNDQVEARLAKLDKLRDMGINPYPYRFAFTHDSAALAAARDALLASGEEVAFAGRIVRFNLKGKLAFVHLKDGNGRQQVMFTLDGVGEKGFELVRLLDIGDWVGVKGGMFITKAGEYTVQAKTVELLSKAVRPLPIPKEKIENGQKVIFDEFKDLETRYRQRYVDLTLNDGVRETFKKRSRILQSVRDYLVGQD
jgi:lysyl-tRNA synthetase class 2